MTSTPINALLTASEVSEKLKVTPQYVRKLINSNALKASRLGSQWVVQTDDLRDFIREHSFVIEPDDHERGSDKVPEIVALSFFSGAMGLDVGMSRGGIKALLACECNKYCRMTIARNEPDMALVGDINDYSPEKLYEMARIPRDRKVDVVFGGPPCQAFSTAGARRAFHDERGNVFLRYVELIEQIRPTYCVIENVRGLLSAPYPCGALNEPVKGGALWVIMERLESAGYAVSFELYNAANFGAPQIRERVVIIGKLGCEKVPYLSPTRSRDSLFGLPKWKTLGEAVADIEDKEQHYVEFPERRLKYYRMLKAGQYWKDLPREALADAMGEKLNMSGGKTGFYRRLDFDKPSPTLVTDPTMPATDLCHPVENRPLSVEEYARIQEFPDDWQISGDLSDQYRQIGNAVPVKLGEAIARTIVADMRGEKLPQYPGFQYSRYRNTNETLWKEQMRKMLSKTTKQTTPDVEQKTLF